MCVCMSGAYVRGCAMSECVCGLELSGSIQSFTIWEDGGTFFRLGKWRFWSRSWKVWEFHDGGQQNIRSWVIWVTCRIVDLEINKEKMGGQTMDNKGK